MKNIILALIMQASCMPMLLSCSNNSGLNCGEIQYDIRELIIRQYGRNQEVRTCQTDADCISVSRHDGFRKKCLGYDQSFIFRCGVPLNVSSAGRLKSDIDRILERHNPPKRDNGVRPSISCLSAPRELKCISGQCGWKILPVS